MTRQDTDQAIEFKVRAYDDEYDAIPMVDTRESDKIDALHQKALWEREGAHVELEKVSSQKEAWEEDECLLCAPEPHPNCEKYTTLQMLDPEKVPLGEDDEDHLVSIPVCLEHYGAFQQYRNGRNVSEVDGHV